MTAAGILIEAIAAKNDARRLEIELRSLGLTEAARFGRVVSGRLPADSVRLLAGVDSLLFARPVFTALRTGATTSQGDLAQHSDLARQRFGVTGANVVVGVLSDSYDCLDGATADRLTGDVSSSVQVVRELADCTAGTDEGRALIQVVADVAPGATPLFHSAVSGQPSHAQAIATLVARGARIIVDDVHHLQEPMFQDGIVAQAIDQAHAAGVAYFSAAGDLADHSYAGRFVSGGVEPITGHDAHDWAASGRAPIDVYQALSVPEDTGFLLVLQWDQPYASAGPTGSASDVDVWLLDNPPTRVVAADATLNSGGDPIEIMGFQNYSEDDVGTDFNLVVTRFSGPPPGVMKYVFVEFAGTVNEYSSSGSTLYGGANANGALAVGSSAYYFTPEYGIEPPGLNPESSLGGTPILLDSQGNPTRIDRLKPDIVCLDGGNNTFFGVDIESDGFPNFFGTSAAAAHAAGIAALMLELAPDLEPGEIYGALRHSALEMGTPGFDTESGFGLCQAVEALALVPIFSDGFESGDLSAWSE